MFLIIYFIGFMIIGSQFIINLFVGVVIDNFKTIKGNDFAEKASAFDAARDSIGQ